MKYFSMFSGIGGFELGIGQKGECVGCSEIDKYAIKVYEEHFPKHKNFGDATKINASELPDFDLLVGGFPCQAFSVAGKKRGFQDTRGTLFFDIARILATKRPKAFILENVKGLLNHNSGETFAVIIETLWELGYDVQWMVLNSKFFGVPQSRERVFIIGNLREQSRPEILPFRQSSGEPDEQCSSTAACTLTSHPSREKGSLIQLNSRMADSQRIYSSSGIARTLKSLGGGQGAKTGLYAIPILTPDRLNKRQNGRRFKEAGDSAFTLTGQDKHGVMVGQKIRRLTPLECERLQGFPDNYTASLSDSQRYKVLGNAVTVNVIKQLVPMLFHEKANV